MKQRNKASGMTKYYSKENGHAKYQNGTIPNGNASTDKTLRHKLRNKTNMTRDPQTTDQNSEHKPRSVVVPPKEVARDMAGLFPRNTHWIVFLFTLVFRVWYVSGKENWWILHPDEIYQTLEGILH